MLYNKEQINNKIDEFKSYCEQQENFKMIKWDSFFTPLYSAVSDYFNSNNEDVSREIAKFIYEDRKVLNVIHFFNLSSYIPTYYKGV